MTAIVQVARSTDFAPARPHLAGWMARIGAILRQIGPYAAIEILLPGGTLMALLLWLYRRSVQVRARVVTSEPVVCSGLPLQFHRDFTAGVTLDRPAVS